MTSTDSKQEPAEVSFSVSDDDRHLLMEIADRAYRDGLCKTKNNKVNTLMDLTAAHANGCPLRLRDLLDADDFNFAHDLYGIDRHLDRTTGKLTDMFRPRFAVQTGAAQ